MILRYLLISAIIMSFCILTGGCGGGSGPDSLLDQGDASSSGDDQPGIYDPPGGGNGGTGSPGSGSGGTITPPLPPGGDVGGGLQPPAPPPI